jgi:Flp pilus assembly protein TadD
VTLAIVEVTLRLAGVGQDTRLVVPVPGHPERLNHQLNDAVDTLYYGRTALTGPETRRFDLPKPAGTYRVVFLGASTVIGFPYPPELAFPRQAEILLELQDPETRYEVLNAGIVSINSFAVADLAEQCHAADPDLIVVHSGHNEFYGPGGPASSALSLPPSLIRTTYLLRRLRLVQLLTSAFSSKPADDDLLNVLPRTMEVPFGGPVFRQAEENLRHNIDRVIEVCRRSSTPLLITSVASNLRDQSPLRAVWPEGVAEETKTRWTALIEDGERQLVAGNAEAALAAFVQAEKLVPGHARGSYRKGQAFEKLGRFDEARTAYAQARDQDACRFRAPSSFTTILREAADRGKEHSTVNNGVAFVDVAAELDHVAVAAGPGFDLYLEHVHYGAEGHRQMGRIFARAILEHCRGKRWDESKAPKTDELDTILGVAPEDHLAAFSFALQVFQTAPLRGAVDADRQDRFAHTEIQRRFAALPKERQEAFADVPMNVMAADLMLALSQIHFNRRNTALAIEFAERGAKRRPWLPESWLQLAKVVDRTGRTAEVQAAIRNALQLRPNWAEAAAFQEAVQRIEPTSSP